MISGLNPLIIDVMSARDEYGTLARVNVPEVEWRPITREDVEEVFEKGFDMYWGFKLIESEKTEPLPIHRNAPIRGRHAFRKFIR